MSHSVVCLASRLWWGVLAGLVCLPLLCACEFSGRRPVPEVLGEMTLTDQRGEELSSRSFEGRIVVVNFMFTSCPAVCPQLTRTLARVRSLLGRGALEDIAFLSISVDPDVDDTAALHSFASQHGADVPGWSFARVSAEDLRTLTERFSVFEPGAPAVPTAHSLAIYLFDPRGQPVQRYDGAEIEPTHLAREINALHRFHSRSR